MCLVLLVVSLTEEPACFISTNALATLCSAALHQQQMNLVGRLVRTAAVHAALCAVPISALLICAPGLLDPLMHAPPPLIADLAAYATLRATAVLASLWLSAAIGLLRSQGLVRETVPSRRHLQRAHTTRTYHAWRAHGPPPTRRRRRACAWP